MTDTTASASKELWLERARSLVPVLRERVEQAETLRRIPDATIRDLRDAGLFRVLQPRRVNGAELEFGALVEIADEFARACASTAWVFANIASHSWMLGMWPEQAQHEIWGNGNFDALIGASLIFPAGRAAPVDDGFRLTGQWNFASGIDACEWIMLAAVVESHGDDLSAAGGEYRMFLVPRSDYTVYDNWFVTGLSGTGSKEVRVADAFVPMHRTLALNEARGGDTPGSAINPGPLYRIPLTATFGYVIAGVPVGIAQGALDRFIGEDRHRISVSTGRVLVGLGPVQMRIAEAAADIDAARRTLAANCARIASLAAEHDSPSIEEKARLRRDAAYATRLSRRAVDSLFEVSGATALYLSNPLQRAFRDIRAATAHIALSWGAAASLYGRVVVGQTADLPPHER